jgi:hypothetical protein
LAQPPDIADTFVKEVDENLRRDQLRDFFKKNGIWVIALVILFLAASGGAIWWQQHKIERSKAEVEQLSQIYKDIGTGNTSKLPAQLDELAKAGSKGVRASALFPRAALALQQNDQKLAIGKYKEILADSSLPKPYHDVALIRQTALEFDELKPEQVIERLEPLTKPGNAWFGSAGETTALAMIKQGKTKEAGQLFAAIAKDQDVPQSIRDRSIQLASSLGVDASAELGPKAQ